MGAKSKKSAYWCNEASNSRWDSRKERNSSSSWADVMASANLSRVGRRLPAGPAGNSEEWFLIGLGARRVLGRRTAAFSRRTEPRGWTRLIWREICNSLLYRHVIERNQDHVVFVSLERQSPGGEFHGAPAD